MFLLPFFTLVGQLLHAFLVWHLGQYLQGVGLWLQHPQRVGHHVAELHTQGVLVDEGGVTEPISDGVVALGGFDDEGILLVEVEPPQPGQTVAAIAEEECEAIGLGSFGLHEVAVGLYFGKCLEHYVVGQKVGVFHLHDGVDAQGVAPDGVLAHVGLERGHDQLVVVGQFFAFLTVQVIVGIGQGITSVGARRYALDDKAAAAVGARHTEHGQTGEGRIADIGI